LDSSIRSAGGSRLELEMYADPIPLARRVSFGPEDKDNQDDDCWNYRVARSTRLRPLDFAA
jgi:hypothetical protein